MNLLDTCFKPNKVVSKGTGNQIIEDHVDKIAIEASVLLTSEVWLKRHPRAPVPQPSPYARKKLVKNSLRKITYENEYWLRRVAQNRDNM